MNKGHLRTNTSSPIISPQREWSGEQVLPAVCDSRCQAILTPTCWLASDWFVGLLSCYTGLTIPAAAAQASCPGIWQSTGKLWPACLQVQAVSLRAESPCTLWCCSMRGMIPNAPGYNTPQRLSWQRGVTNGAPWCLQTHAVPQAHHQKSVTWAGCRFHNDQTPGLQASRPSTLTHRP